LNPDEMPDEPHLPSPSLWPIGFAIGVAVLLVGLIIDPLWVSTIGGAIAIVFGILWARDATSELRGRPLSIPPEHRVPGAAAPDAAATEPALTEHRFGRNKFLEGTTIGLGAVIGGMITVPIAGFAVLPGFLGQKRHKVDLGPASDYTDGQWYIATFMLDPSEGETSRRTAFVRSNGLVAVKGKQVPSFTIISNRCTHVGCPTEPNGPLFTYQTKNLERGGSPVRLIPVEPAGFGCPCHGGQYDTEGNRTAGPPVRALDRYDFEIDNGRVILLSTYSVAKVDGTGGQAKIHKYKEVGPGEHVDGPEQWFYPLNPPHH